MGVEYAIRDVVVAAQKLEATNRKIIYLNIGDPPQFGFHPSRQVLEALGKAALNGHNHYAPSEGLLQLRKEIANKERIKGLECSENDIIITNGVSEALDMVISSIVEDGDEVLLPGPYYPPYASYIRLHGGIPIEFSTNITESKPDLEDIKKKITKRTVAICLINPNNPSGTVFDEKSLKSIIDIAIQHDLYIICDEIYDKIVYDKKFTGIGKVASGAPVIVLNGFSKVNLMTGFRVGYIAFSSSPKLKALREHLPKLARVRISTNLPSQYAALESLRQDQSYITEFVSELRKRRDLVVKRLNDITGLSCATPQGAFYAFPKIEDDRFTDDKKFVLGLLESKGVLTVHGSGFGKMYGSGHFRIVFLPQLDTLENALDSIRDYMA